VPADRIELLALEDGLELHATWLRRPLHEIHVGIEEPPAAFAGRLRGKHHGVARRKELNGGQRRVSRRSFAAREAPPRAAAG
jgi:hypothetical protein